MLVVMVVMVGLWYEIGGVSTDVTTATEEAAESGQSGIKTWVQDIRPGYKIDLAHYRETQVDHISEFVRVVPVVSLAVVYGWGGCGDLLAV